MPDHAVQRVCQRSEALFSARRRADRRNAEQGGELCKVDVDAFGLCLIHHIDTDKHVRRDLQRLQNQSKPSLEAGRIAHHNDCVRVTEADKIARDLLLGGSCIERVGARNIDERITARPRFADACGV